MACASPASGAISSGFAPAFSRACHGSVSSTCSMPSFATSTATFLPSIPSAIWTSFDRVSSSGRYPSPAPLNRISFAQKYAAIRQGRRVIREVSGSLTDPCFRPLSPGTERRGRLRPRLISAAHAVSGTASASARDRAGISRGRHREGARFTIGRIQELGGLRGGLPPKHAQALFALSTNHEAWRELTEGHHLGWDTAEARLTDALTRSLLA